MGEIKAATVSFCWLCLHVLDSHQSQVESLGNLKKVLELSGSSLEKVVKFNSEHQVDVTPRFCTADITKSFSRIWPRWVVSTVDKTMRWDVILM